MLLRPCAPRDLAVGDVAEQYVLEGVLRVACDSRSSLAGDEVLSLQSAQPPLRFGGVDACGGGDAAKPEDFAVHRCLLKQLLLGAGQRVDSRGDDALHRFRELSGRSPLRQHPHVLLREKRVPARSLQQCSLLIRELKRLLHERSDQPRRVLFSEWLQRDRGRVRLAATPRRSPLQQLGPRGSDDKQRHTAEPVDEVVEKVQQTIIGPVQILEHEHRRPSVGDRFEKATPRRRRGLGTGAPRTVAADTDERAQRGLEPAPLARFGNQPRHGLAELALRVRTRVALEDPRLRLDDLAERPERHALAVGETAALAPGDQLRFVIHEPEELADDARFPDARDTDDRDELRGELVADAAEDRAQQLELAVTAEERRLLALGEVNAVARHRIERLPDRDRVSLPLRLDSRGLAVSDRIARRAIGRRPHQHTVNRRRGLHSSRRIDDVARDHRLARRGTRADVHERLTRVHPHPHLQIALLRRPVPDRKCSAQGPLGIILVSHRRAEDGHHRVTDELLHRAAAPLQLFT